MSNAWDNIGTELKTGGKREKADWLKLVNGNNVIRILTAPYIRYSHWIPSANVGIDCIGKDCPICKINAELREAGQKDKCYSSSKKFLMYVYNRVSGKIELWDIGKTMMSSIFNEMNERKEDGKSFDPTTFDLRIRKADTGTSFKSIDEKLDDAVLEQLASFPNISDVTVKLDQDQIKELLSGKTLKELFAPDADATTEDTEIVLG